MNFLISTIPLSGHTNPMVPLATELTSRGHTVLWLTGNPVKRLVESTGARFIPTDQLAICDETVKPDPNKIGISAVISLLRSFITNRIISQVADYRSVLKTFSADAIVVETLPLGAQALYELGEGPIYATLGIFPMYTSDPIVPPAKSGRQPPRNLLQRIINRIYYFFTDWYVFGRFTPLINQQRSLLGLRAISRSETVESCYQSKWLHIEPACPSFEFPRSKPIPHVHFVGPLIPPAPPSFSPPSWWDEVVAHPKVIHITQGTYTTFAKNLTLPAIRAVGSMPDVLIVITVPENDTTFQDRSLLPSNVRIHQYIPHAILLPHVNLVITNAGHGGVKAALTHGVPLICAGQTEDKMDVSARVAWSGVGIDLKTDRPTEKQIKDAVEKVLGEKSYADAAKKMAEECKVLGGAKKACDLLEALVMQKKARSPIKT